MAVGDTVAVCHYRVGRTDGVSLQIAERKRLLEEMGYRVRLIAGERQSGADHVIPELEFDRPEIVRLKQNAFFALRDYAGAGALLEDIRRAACVIEARVEQIRRQYPFRHLFLHNIFTHARHVASALAFHSVFRRGGLNMISVDHDMFWTGSYRDLYRPTDHAVEAFLAEHVPPREPGIRHTTINSLARDALRERAGLTATVIPDTFDFHQPPFAVDAYNRDLPAELGLREDDLVVLQATRISERKGIELAIDLVRMLRERLDALRGRTLYNGKRITRASRVVLLLAGYAEEDSREYRAALEAKSARDGVPAVFASDRIAWERGRRQGRKVYALWDTYAVADLVTYPSQWEGWGNQFLEAVFARKPVAVFEYPVFQADIKPEGYDTISLGSQTGGRGPDGLLRLSDAVLARAADAAVAALTDPGTRDRVERNFRIGMQHHDNRVQIPILESLLRQ